MQAVQPIIAPAIMADEWDLLIAQIESISGIATNVQIDVMDGNLVPPVSFPYNQTTLEDKGFPHTDSIEYEVHLMVHRPQLVGHQFIDAGAKRIVAQIEGFKEREASKVFQEWKDASVETGVSILLDTPIENIAELIEEEAVSFVQIMSIAQIGYQGNPFDERTFVRIEELRELYPEIIIAVDGGVSEDNIEALVRAGANRFGVGSAIMKATDPAEAYKNFDAILKGI